MSTRNYLTVNRTAIRNNLLKIRGLSPRSVCYGVVKANAYGLGAAKVAAFLERDVDGFCVATPEEAMELRAAGIERPVLCLGFVGEEWIAEFIEKRIRPSVYTVALAEKFEEYAGRLGRIHPIHIAFDTGHHRIGFRAESADTLEALQRIAGMEHVKIEGAFSHFATADEEDASYTNHQIDLFRDVCERAAQNGVDLGIRHIANDAGVLCHRPQALFDGMRLGIGLYGVAPSDYVASRCPQLFEPVFQWQSVVNNVKVLEAGERLSYGLTWQAEHDCVIATVQAGYADGYLRLLSNCADVVIHGRRCPVRGRVCMDQMMVEVPEDVSVSIGDTVYLIGGEATGERVTVEELARLAQTIPYELMTGISARVGRRYEDHAPC